MPGEDLAHWPTLPPEEMLAEFVALLDDFGSILRRAPEHLIPVLPHLVPHLPRITGQDRYEAVRFIGQTHPPAVSDMLRVFKDADCWYLRCPLGDALAYIGPPALPALIQGLCDPDAKIRNLAGWALRAMRPAPDLPAATLLKPLARIMPEDALDVPTSKTHPGNVSLFVTGEGHRDGFHPIQDAPLFEARGGVVYVSAVPPKEAFFALLQSLGIQAEMRGFAVFARTSSDPNRERYLVQLRAVAGWALRHMFSLWRDAYDPALLDQPQALGDLLWAFVGHQQGYWGTIFADRRAPSKLFGGDGEYAQEELAFGLMAERPGVCRIWSRAILIEK